MQTGKAAIVDITTQTAGYRRHPTRVLPTIPGLILEGMVLFQRR